MRSPFRPDYNGLHRPASAASGSVEACVDSSSAAQHETDANFWLSSLHRRERTAALQLSHDVSGSGAPRLASAEPHWFWNELMHLHLVRDAKGSRLRMKTNQGCGSNPSPSQAGSQADRLRQSLGRHPNFCLKRLVKCERSENPQSSAIVPISLPAMAGSFRSSAAPSRRRSIT
jgi:hypothetical protein